MRNTTSIHNPPQFHEKKHCNPSIWRPSKHLSFLAIGHRHQLLARSPFVAQCLWIKKQVDQLFRLLNLRQIEVLVFLLSDENQVQVPSRVWLVEEYHNTNLPKCCVWSQVLYGGIWALTSPIAIVMSQQYNAESEGMGKFKVYSCTYFQTTGLCLCV